MIGTVTVVCCWTVPIVALVYRLADWPVGLVPVLIALVAGVALGALIES